LEFLAELHPFFIHFPIALFFLYFVFEILNLLSKSFNSATIIILGFGVLMGLFSVLTGNQAFQNIPSINTSESIIMETLDNHEFYATLLLWYYFVILVFRYFLHIKKRVSKKYKIMFICLSLLGLFFLYQTGKFGNELVYKYGIGTLPAVEILR